MSDPWATPSNESLHLRLIGASHLGNHATFHPLFTYPIFGEAETIYGHKNLRIYLDLQTDSLLGRLDIQSDGKLESKNAKIDNPREALQEYLPKDDVIDSTCDPSKSLEEFASERGTFVPCGQKIHSYTRSTSDKGKARAHERSAMNLTRGGASTNTNGMGSHRRFEVYHCTWNTPQFCQYHRRMQLFALLFIEGASYIDEEEANWEFLVTFEVTQADNGPQYHFVGYTSLYNFWFYPKWYRLRLSQLVILPPYQSSGHGSELYGQVVRMASDRENVVELTIEDPSEAFDKLRDSNDLKRLLSPDDGFLLRAKEFVKGGALRAPIDKAWSETERKRHKIAKRQWDRLVEMCQLMMLDETDTDQITKLRLQIKSRLYGFNRDVLQQMPPNERVAKLQETYESVMDEYGVLTGVDVDPIIDAPLDIQGDEDGSTSKIPRFS